MTLNFLAGLSDRHSADAQRRFVLKFKALHAPLPSWRNLCLYWVCYRQFGYFELAASEMDRFTARRRLLRGSLSAPLVLTVASPAALARQSFEACLFRASRYPAQADIFINADSHDTWLRIKVPVYSLSLKPPEPLVPPSSEQQVGGSTSNDPKATSASPEPSAVPTEQVSVAGSSLAPEEPTPQNTTPPEEFYGFEGAYYRVNPSSRVECNLAFAADDFDPPPSEATYIGDRLGLVYVDESGELVGMGPCPVEGGFPVSNSCWASFNAGKQG